MTIIIDPRSNYSYSSFYLLGLAQLYGMSRISYNLKPFKELDDPGNNMRFTVKGKSGRIKVFIQTDDYNRVYETDYAWSNIYGSVNANFRLTPRESYPKLISLAPSFGVRTERYLAQAFYGWIVRFLQTWHYVIRRKEWNHISQKAECNQFNNVKHFFSRRFKGWKYRLPLSAYTNDVQSEDNYIFFLATLWYNDQYNKNDEKVNLSRAYFIRACRSVDALSFDGGLVGKKTGENVSFHDVITSQRIPIDIWLEKTKRSTLVFNTPAFWGCHGWKLGEYLCLGKCIVSTPLNNDLPYPLEHGVNIHFVENTVEAMSEAIEYIISHPDYRHSLERGARNYWEKYGAPLKSLARLGFNEIQ